MKLSEAAKANLRAAIRNKPAITHSKQRKSVLKVGSPKKNVGSPKVKETMMTATNVFQPLVLATASDWIVPGNLMSSAILGSKKEASVVELL